MANVTEQMRPRFRTKTNLEGLKETEAETSSRMLLVAKDFVESTQFLLRIQKVILGRRQLNHLICWVGGATNQENLFWKSLMFDPKTGRKSARRQEIIKFLKPLNSQHTCFLPSVWAEVYGEARNDSIPLCARHDSTHQLSHNSNTQTAGVTELANPTRRKAPASHLTPLFTPEFPEVHAPKKGN